MKHIIFKYLTGSITDDELDLLVNWLKTEKNRIKFEQLVREDHNINLHYTDIQINEAESLKKLKQLIAKAERPVKKLYWRRYVAAAAVLVVFMAIGFIIKQQIGFGAPNTQSVVLQDIHEGSNKATLTLENGENIALDKGFKYSSKTAKSNGKTIVYKKNNPKTKEIAYNTLTVPRGGQYQITLSDGTKVWLNSDSKLKYPVSFIKGETRAVELVYGEAYFDVSPSTAHHGATFKVLNNFQDIEVLGTQFNVNAYNDELLIATTLVEGKVRVSSLGKSKDITPSQQTLVGKTTNHIVVKKVNVKDVISWRDGVFSFNDRSLEAIAKVLSRWYDVNIQFNEDHLKVIRFNGQFRKNQSLTEILNLLTISPKISYDIKDKTILIK